MFKLFTLKSWLCLAATGVVLATLAGLGGNPTGFGPSVLPALVRRDNTPPSFASGSNGTVGSSPGANGNAGGEQPTPQTGTLDKTGTYSDMDCGQGGNGGGGADGTLGSGTTPGGKGGNGTDGKKGAAITIYITAPNVTLSYGHGPNGGRGGSAGNGGAGHMGGAAGTIGAGGTRGTIYFTPSGGGSGFNAGSFVLPVDGEAGAPGSPGADLH